MIVTMTVTIMIQGTHESRHRIAAPPTQWCENLVKETNEKPSRMCVRVLALTRVVLASSGYYWLDLYCTSRKMNHYVKHNAHGSNRHYLTYNHYGFIYGFTFIFILYIWTCQPVQSDAETYVVYGLNTIETYFFLAISSRQTLGCLSL